MNPSRSGSDPFREWKRRQAYRILPVFAPLGYFLIKGLNLTMNVRFSEEPPVRKMLDSKSPFVLVFFHGRQFLLVHQLRNWPNTIMTSISYMGEIQALILKMFGYKTIQGSSSKGGARVLAKMIGHIRRGRVGTFAVDGPRGPYRDVKPGAIFAAKKLGVPVVPVSTSAWPSLIIENVWDRYLLPLPFSRGLVHFGEPMFLDRDVTEESIKRDCQRIGRVLEELEAEADALIGRTRQ
jgi:hypothetical protein